MNKAIFVFSFFLFIYPLAMQAQQAFYSLDFTLSKKNFADTITITQEHDRVLVPVTIGARSYQFLLDTGASQAVVFEDMMIEGCEAVGQIASHDANERKTMVQVVTLPPLTIGTLTMTGCRATVQKRLGDRKIDGILGFDIVNKGLQMKIDARGKRLIITDRKKFFAEEPGFRLKYTMQRYVPYIEVSPFRSYQETVRFDTGSPLLYTINDSSFNAGKPLMANPGQIKGRGTGRLFQGYSGIEPRSEKVFLALDSLSVGGFILKDLHTLSITQGSSHIGAGILKYGAVIFVPQKKTMILQPYDGGGSYEADNCQIEKAVVSSDDGLPMIGLVCKHSEAFRAGFREGDIIIKADGQSVGSYEEYKRYRSINQHIYNFEVRDCRGFTKEVKAKW